MRKLFFTLFVTMIGSVMAQTGMDKTAMEIAQEMMPGWNLGNTMEASNWRTNTALWNNEGGLDAEIAWQSTRTTQEIINYVKEQGFRSIRIPCAWALGHITDADAKTIDTAWMNRVKEVVDYCINAGLYVVLNDHWDGGWLEEHIADKDRNTIDGYKDTLTKLWTQIAETFKDYDEHLLFAGLNEPNADNQSATNNLMEYHQTFVNAVRATGGNNARRVLIVQGPNTDIDKTCQYLTHMPDDIVSDRLAVEIHFYYPWNFWGMENDESWGNCFYYWGEGNHVSESKHNATYGEEADMLKLVNKLKKSFINKGIPVINGEYGVNWRTVSGTNESQTKHNASIKAYYKYMNKVCFENNIVPMVWDTNSGNGMTIINRSQRTIACTYMMEGIQEAIEETGIHAAIREVCGTPRQSSSSFYNLNGQRTDHPAHGIYIYQGKKVVVR